MSTDDSRWFEQHCARGTSALRLFCIPHAGQSRYPYQTWLAQLPETIELFGVRLPGRGARSAEVSFRRMEPLVAALGEAVTAHLDKPFALFGHSMGALIAFELCAWLEQRGLEARHLFVSGTRAPYLGRADQQLYDLPREQFMERLRTLNGTAAELLEDETTVASILPTLRADFEVVETYPEQERPQVTCPITALGGQHDTTVSERELEAWSRYTTKDFRCRFFPGGHFFITTEQTAVLRTLSETLRAI